MRLHEQTASDLRFLCDQSTRKIGNELLPDRHRLAGFQFRAQARVALGRGFRIELSDDRAELLGTGDDGADMRLAFDLVAVEQGIIRLAAQYQRQLPGEIGRVTYAGAEPLPQERRRLMHGIAHQEDATIAPALPE